MLFNHYVKRHGHDMRRHMLEDVVSLGQHPGGDYPVFRLAKVGGFELEDGKGQRRHNLGFPGWAAVGRVGEVSEEKRGKDDNGRGGILVR
jgi:hypothetical protein